MISRVVNVIGVMSLILNSVLTTSKFHRPGCKFRSRLRFVVFTESGGRVGEVMGFTAFYRWKVVVQ